jgi:hypothetical protein
VLARAYYALLTPAPSRNPDPPTGVILLEMRRYVTEKGAKFAVGLQHGNAELEKFLNDFKIQYVDLGTTNASHIYPEFGKHWTPEGHAFVADKIDALLKRTLNAD